MATVTLAESLIDRFTNDTDPEITALKAVLPMMVFDVNWSNDPRPYCVVEDKLQDVQYQPIGKACRVDKMLITFSVYCDTRHETNEIMGALEAAYIDASLTTVTDGVILGTPEVNDRFIRREKDSYHGSLNLIYYLERN